MNALEERPLDKLFDMILNILWQDLLELWRVIHAKMATEGAEAVKSAFEAARQRLLAGPLENQLEVRWGLNLCPFCNDDNVDKNGISYVTSTGDGLEFNQCLNCRIGFLYNLVVAKATMDSYTIGLGAPDQFNGMSFYWNAIVPEGLNKFQPMYEIVSEGQWRGSVSFDEGMNVRFLPFEAMTDSTPRDAETPWTTEIPDDIQAAVTTFVEVARPQIEVALALR